MTDRALDSLARASRGAAGNAPPASRLQELRRRWPTLVAALIIGGAAGYGGSFAVTPTFMSSTLFIPPQQQQGGAASALASLGALSSLAGGSGVKNATDQYISMMQSNTVSDRIITRFGLDKVYETKFKDDARKALSGNVQIGAGKKDGMIRVSVEDIDSKRAAAMANQYVDELRAMTSRLALSDAQQRRTFFERMVDETKRRLVAAQASLESSGFTAGALRAEPRAAADTYAKLRAELTAAQIRLQVTRTNLAEGSPEVRQQVAAEQALSEQVTRLEQSQSTDEGSADYIGKYRNFKYQESLFELYSKQYESARLDESHDSGLIQVVDEAQPAERKYAPHRSTYTLFGGVIALLITAGTLWRRTVASPSASL